MFLKITLFEVVLLELVLSHEKCVYLAFSCKLCQTLDTVRETKKLYQIPLLSLRVTRKALQLSF